MAVLSKYPGLEVVVNVNNQPLQEYDDDSEDTPHPNTISKYVEAKSGAQFTVLAHIHHPFSTPHGVLADLYIDDKAINSYIVRNEELYRVVFKWENHRWQKHGEWVQQEFHFSELDVVEEDCRSRPNIAALRRHLGSKGDITVQLWFVKDIHSAVAPKPRKVPVQLTTLNKIPEKAPKGNTLSHQVSLTKPRRAQIQSEVCDNYTLVETEPFAVFHFKYRSLASLQALRVVKIDETTQVPLEEKLEEDLSPEELRELVRRMRQREAESATIKQKKDASTHIKLKRILYDDDEVTVIESRPCKRARVDRETIIID